MSSQENKEVIRRVFDAISGGDMKTLESLLADDVVEHEEFPGLEPNKEGVLAFFRHMRTAFPDMKWMADDLLADADLVAVRGRFRGTHQGEFMDIPGSGNSVEVPLADFFRVRDGKVVEHWGVTDTGSLMQQLGAWED